jgi:hypothetical protein
VVGIETTEIIKKVIKRHEFYENLDYKKALNLRENLVDIAKMSNGKATPT